MGHLDFKRRAEALGHGVSHAVFHQRVPYRYNTRR